MTRWLFGEPGTPKATYRMHEFLLVAAVGVLVAYGIGKIPLLGYRNDAQTGARMFGLVQQLEMLSQDVRFISRHRAAPTQVAIVAIDEVTLKANDQKTGKPLGQWPFPRDYHAQLVRNLKADGARAIVFDVLFNEPDRMGKDADLAAAMKEAGNVFLPLTNEGSRFSESAIKQKLGSGVYAPDLIRRAARIGAIRFPLEELYGAAAGTGYFEAMNDPDGKFRRISPFFNLQNTEIVIPHLSLEVARFATNLNQAELKLDEAGGSFAFSTQRVPLIGSGFVLDFYGGAGAIHTVSYSDVYNGHFRKGLFGGRVVIVGATAAGLHDIRPNPYDQGFPGVELNATLIANLLESDFVHYTGNATNWGMIALFCLSMWLFVARMSLLGGAFFTAGMMGIYGSLAFGVFQYQPFALMLPMVQPLMTILFAYVVVTAYRAFTEEKQKKFYNETFRQYVPPEFVDLIAENPSMLDMGGERKIVSCLFSDVRGFTTWSEQGEPHEVVSQLNDYLTVMAEVLSDQKGTLDKFIGDAIMAFWNAPVEQEDHAERCVRTALGMQYALRVLHERWEEEGRPLLNIGIGMNTGYAVVGNTGSPNRKNYTLLGDSVNLAARLEGVTKEFHITSLVSENTFRLVEEKFIGREIDLLRVKGKLEPVRIYEILADRENGLAAEMKTTLEHYHAGLAAYKERKWEDALDHFVRALMVDQLNPDGPSLTYRDRCREYLENPPPEDWGGVYVMTKK